MAFFELPTMMAFSALTMWTSSPRMARLAACVAMRPSTRPVASMTVTAPFFGAWPCGAFGAAGALGAAAGVLEGVVSAMGSPEDPAALAAREGLDGLLEGED